MAHDVSDDFAPEELQMLRSFFRDEANDVLEKLTSKLLQLGAAHPGDDMFSQLMRTTHTLKGSAGTVGLSHIVVLAHTLEDRFAHIHAGKIEWSRETLDCVVDAVDALRALCDDVEESTAQELLAQRVEEKLRKLGQLARRQEEKPLRRGAEASTDHSDADQTTRARRSRPRRRRRQSDLQLQPPTAPAEVSDGVVEAPNPESAHKNTSGRDSGTHSITAGELSGVHEIRPEHRANVSGRVVRVEAQRLDGLMDSAGELVFDRTRIERRVQRMRGVIRDLGRMRQRARDEMAALRSATSVEERVAVADTFREIESELAHKIAQLSRAAGALLDDTEALRITSNALQQGLTKMRMQTAGALFQRLAPPLRSIARAAGKRIKLEIAGGDTEFDKSVAEQIVDPLVQLLRNAVAHGVEAASERASAGKPIEGRIQLSARQSGGLVIIEVADDGAGIDPAALRDRFVQMGRWSPGRAQLASDDDVLRSIFNSGMTSRDSADELAGRGVGLDAVRESIARLGGEIHLTSTPGRGTTFVLRLPVSTAVSQSLLFKVQSQVYAVPNIHVLESTTLEVALGQLPSLLDVRGEQLPVVNLHSALGGAIPFDSHIVPALVMDYLGKRFAVSCDKVVGPREIVVKSLGPLLAPLPLFAGGTISDSGKVQFILDSDALLRMAHPDSTLAEATDARSDHGAHSADAASASPHDGAWSDVAGRALVADDSRAICEAMSRMLARQGYVVDVADDGQRAWEMLQEVTYDILLTDLEMPELDGFGLIERLRASESHRSIPVIIISSRSGGANRRRAEDLGVKSFVTKPISRKKLAVALAASAAGRAENT